MRTTPNRPQPTAAACPDYDRSAELIIKLRTYKPNTVFDLPLSGPLLVWDAHDFFAHHRRIPLDTERSRRAGVQGTNANRYALDFVVVDASGAMYHDDPYHKENFLSYGRPIYAPAAGRVVRCRNDAPENEFEGKHIRYPPATDSRDDDLGNYILLDHGHGEYSVLPHMQPGSVQVTAGEHVKAGQVLGQVGFSGDAIFPHVHFALLSGTDLNHSEGLPAYFHHIGSFSGAGADAPVSLPTGILVQSTMRH